MSRLLVRRKILPLLLLVCPSFGWGQAVRVTVRVYTPPATRSDDRVYITGNDSAVGMWSPSGLELAIRDDSSRSGSFLITKGFRLEFKITRGSWNSEALYTPGVIPANTILDVDHDTTLDVRPCAWSESMPPPRSSITGTVEFLRRLKGQGLRYARDVIVWLPPSYKTTKKRRYPVLYMHDGQNVFDPSTSFSHVDWGVDETCDSLMRSGKMEEVIVVAVYNSPDRMLEYSDTSFGRAYGDFFVHKLKPLIDSKYRTKPDRDHTAIMGSSLGGLISFLFLYWYPDIFSKAGCLSSAFSYRDRKVFRQFSKTAGFPKPVKIYMDCGGVGMEGSLKPQMDEMAGLLQKIGLAEGKDFIRYFDPAAEHHEKAWAQRVWRPLIFFFGKQ
ncbi:MAG TPA: alpha/beta hydrolase-fold protein [Bacteroidota bacterium]|nr:alpha/beta hydrolase-fold protein [Bacteroidota bacterium]